MAKELGLDPKQYCAEKWPIGGEAVNDHVCYRVPDHDGDLHICSCGATKEMEHAASER